MKISKSQYKDNPKNERKEHHAFKRLLKKQVLSEESKLIREELEELNERLNHRLRNDHKE